MLIFVLENQLERFLSYLPQDQKKYFQRSFAEKTLEDWSGYFQVLNQATFSLSNKLQSWTCPHCFHKNHLNESFRTLGEQCLKNGEVAFLTVAGGLGTRLNFNGPKGLFPVTPLKRKPLFQVFAEKLIALQRRYGRPCHWLIMTSDDTHEATVAAFRKNAWYDLKYVHFFKQGTVPAFDRQKRCLIQENGFVRYFPDGHGGVFNALKRSNLLNALEDWGVKTISYFQVDNPLVILGDTLFLGLHLEKNSDFSTKVVAKRSPEERVGVFVQESNKLRLVEYSEMPTELAKKQDDLGQLVFRYGNTAIHLLSLSFVKKATEIKLPYHAVEKQMVAWDPDAQEVRKQFVYKLESFIFDALPYAHNPVLLEVAREDEFSPIKNATGNDTPETCLRDQTRCWLRWVKEKYIFDEKKLAEKCIQLNNRLLEVSPLFAEDARGFSKKWDCMPRKYEEIEGLYLEEEHEDTHNAFRKGF